MIVSCGEALIDFVPATTADGRSAYVPCVGGSPFNIAVGIGRLGVPAAFLGGVSNDFFGDALVAALRTSNVDTRYVRRLGRPSMLAFVRLDAAEPEYVFYDAESAPRFWEAAEPLRDDVTLLHLGSISLLGEPAARRLVALMAENKGRRLLSLDPNIRPSMIPDEAGYRARLRTVLDLADIVKISAADLAWLAPEVTPEAAAQAWLTRGTSLVVVTLGPAGAVAFARAGAVRCAGVPVAVVDTVGAGDSFMSALLAGLVRLGVERLDQLQNLGPESVATAVGFAARASAITCSRRGADPPWRNEIDLAATASA